MQKAGQTHRHTHTHTNSTFISIDKHQKIFVNLKRTALVLHPFVVPLWHVVFFTNPFDVIATEVLSQYPHVLCF